MPGKVKVKIISGKNLPVMDRSSDTTDAYVEIKLGNTTYKTDVCRRTLHPQWNTDWYRFEVDDSELQDEPLQIRLMDHDTYSANDAIGKVYLNLNPLLLPVAGQLAIGDNNPHHEISGWIPVYDTMHGIRGEVNVTVKVELFSDFNRFRQSSCGVHFFYSPTVPQGYQAKVINGFVEELIVDDDPEYQWIDKIRTPRASNEARQTLFFKLSGELQRKIGVKALSLGGNAVIGYKQCFDLEGESGIVARGIGTAVTLVKVYNVLHATADTKEENIENYLKFVGDGKSFSLCSTSPPHKFHGPLSIFQPIIPDITPLISRLPKLTKRQYASLDSNLVSPSISNPNLPQGESSIKVLLNQEDKRGKSAMSRRFQKFKHSQKSLSKKMIALKAKLNESIGEETDENAVADKRRHFKRTSSDSSAMAEILARSVMRAATSLSCILEDQPHTPKEDETMDKLEPIANLLNQPVSENSIIDEIASDVQSCSSSDSSSSCSDYEYKDYSKANNDVETLSNIISNVEKLQRCLSKEGLQKQYSLPAIPTKGFSLSSLDSLGQFEACEDFKEMHNYEGRLMNKNSSNDSLLTVSTSASNLSDVGELNQQLIRERRASDTYDSRVVEAIRPFIRRRELERFEVDLQESLQKSIENLELVTAERKALTCEENPLVGKENIPILFQTSLIDPSSQGFTEIEPEIKGNLSSMINIGLQTVLSERSSMLESPTQEIKNKEFEFPCVIDQHPQPWSKKRFEVKKEPKTIFNTALQTMLLERAGILGTPTEELNKEEMEFIADQEPKTEHTEPGPKGIVKTALQTMLIERADILGTDFLSAKNRTHSEMHEISQSHDEKKEIKPKSMLNTALETMLIERADILGTDSLSIKNRTGSEIHETHQSHDDKKETKPNSMLNTALETMLIERADILGTDSLSIKNRTGSEIHEPHQSHDDKKETKPKSMLNTALETMLIERADILGTDSLSIKNRTDAEIHETHQSHDDKKETKPKSMLNTALETMLIERADILGTDSLNINRTGSKRHETHQSHDDKKETKPKSMLNTALETMLIERADILGTDSLSIKNRTDAEIHETHQSHDDKKQTKPKSMLNTPLETMLIERSDILGTDSLSIKNRTGSEIHETHQSHDDKKETKPNSMLNTALETMLIERADILGTDSLSIKNRTGSEMHETHQSHDDKRDANPKSMLNTALETMLIERADILGTDSLSIKNRTGSEIHETHQSHDDKRDAKPKSMLNTALETMLIERADILGTDSLSIKNRTGSEIHETHQSHDDKRDAKPKSMLNTALETMLVERADILGTDSLSMKHPTDSEMHRTDQSHGVKKETKSEGMLNTALETMLIERADILGTDSVNIKNRTCSEIHETHQSHDGKKETKPKSMLNTALETMLIERVDILGTDSLSIKNRADSEMHRTDQSHDVKIETESKSMLNTALERADILGTDSISIKNPADLEEHQIDQFHGDKKETKPKSMLNTALETMLIERADILGTGDPASLKIVFPLHESVDKIREENVDVDLNDMVKTTYQTMLSKPGNKLADQQTAKSNMIGKKQMQSMEDLEIHNPKFSDDSEVFHKADISSFQRPDLNAISPISLENICIEPDKMVKTAMQTMLLEKFNILNTYSPPNSPRAPSEEFKGENTESFTFGEVGYERKTIPKSSSSASFGEHQRQKETVLGMPFTSLSSLLSEYENELKPKRPSFLSDTHLHEPRIETLKDKARGRKRRFKFHLSNADKSGKHSGIFHKFRGGSKKSPPSEPQKDTSKEHHQNILSRMFHLRHEEKSIKDEETQTSNEILDSPQPPQLLKINPSPNIVSKTKIYITTPKPPGHIDLASGDFLAHSKTKSACITSHHSSPAQERQDQSNDDRKDEHIPDSGLRTSHSPVKVNCMVSLHRRSSDSDLSITPKGNSLTGSDKSLGNTGAYFMRNNYIRRGQMNQEHFDMLEYPFLTMAKFPPRFVTQIGGSISARSVKLLERILNVDEPESRDIWWSEIRMEIRSHARSLNCNAVLGYTELTSICDDVCILSACGTAVVIDFNSSAGNDDNFSNVQLIHKNVERDKHLNGHHKVLHDSPDHRGHPVYPCSITHLPYDEKTVPLKAKVTKCPVCLKGKVPEVLIATIEPPESIPSIGKGCFIESHVSRHLKDVRGETIAKEISDGLPFLEYELHRLLVNKLKIKGMNAIFSLKIRISVGEKMLVGVATGTAIYLSCLPSPDLPMLVTDKVSDEKLVANLQEMLNQTVKKNKEIYQIKDDNQNQRCLSDEDSDGEQASLDISCGNKDCCILEMDDPEDAEVLRLLMQEKVPDGFHVVSTESVPGLEELEIVKNLQMFTQIYRAKLSPPYNLQKHFIRLLQGVYFKLRRMIPCALCDLQFRIDVPEPDEIQLCVIGMALGLGKKAIKGKPVTVPKKTVPEEDLIFKLDEDHPQENPAAPVSKSNQSSLKFRSHRSPSKYRPQSVKQRHIPYNERHGVDITPLSYVPGGHIEQYLGNLNFFFIRETTSIREEGGLSGFIHSFITEVLAIVRSHVTALGGNALVAFFMTECILNHNLHKNQGQCLINVGGDVVSVSYIKDES